MTSSRQRPALYARIRYRMDLETQALERLEQLDPDGCRAIFGKLLMQLEFPPRASDSLQVVQLLLDILQRVNRLMQNCSRGTVRFHENRVALIEGFSRCNNAVAARDLFLPALDILLESCAPAPFTFHPLVEKAISHINADYRRPLSLSRVAHRLAASPEYLSRLFTREAGMTLTAYIQRVRLRHARMLLADSGRSISEIAYRVGYQNYRDFYRNFVKYEHASPRQVRRKLCASWQAAGNRHRGAAS